MDSPLREIGLVGASAAITGVVETCLQVAPSDATVLLLGETGTGKELLARAIHSHSGRRGDFVAVNCGAISESLVESELFGHTKGAFTGATEEKPGLFRRANHGTLLLDEIGSLPLSAQHTLLRVLQERRVRPVGSSEEHPIDVRVIAATSVPLLEALQLGTFREDLFYRLDVIRVVVPPLRNRSEDVLPLFCHFCETFAERHGTQPPQVTSSFEARLVRYAWPGNVRQLENLTERLVLTRAGSRLDAAAFDELLGPAVGAGAPASSRDLAPPARAPEPAPAVDLSQSLEEFLEQWERVYLEAALASTDGRVAEAAEVAGLSRRTLSRKLKKLEIDRREARAPSRETPVLWLSAPPLEPFPLDPRRVETTIGRSVACDLVIPFPGVSRVHVRLRPTRGEWWVEDAGSRNGTLLNGDPVQGARRLRHGDVLLIEPFRFRVTESKGAPDPHNTTFKHLVSFPLAKVPLTTILERFRESGRSAELNVGSVAGNGTIKLHEGEVSWACYSAEGQRLEGRAAVAALEHLADGLCVVSAIHDTHLVRHLLETSDEMKVIPPDAARETDRMVRGVHESLADETSP